MSHQKTYVRALIAIGCGFVTVVAINLLMSIFIIQQIRGSVKGPTPMDTYVYNTSILATVSILAPIIGGGVTGYLMKKKGWVYGGILGVVIKVVSLILLVSLFFWPTLVYGKVNPSRAMYLLAQKNIIRHILGLPFTVILVALGGWAGEWITSMKEFRLTQKR